MFEELQCICRYVSSCNVSRVEHSSWLGRYHRNPVARDQQELCMTLLSLSLQDLSYNSPNPVVLHSYLSQPITLFLHHHFLGIPASIPSYLFTLSKHKLSHLDVLCGLVSQCAAACFAPRSVSKATLLLHRHFASKGSPLQHHYLEMGMMEAAWWTAVNKHLPNIFTGP